jgi:hypothetical protein
VSRAKFRWSNSRYSGIVSAAVFGKWLTSLPDTNPATVVEHAANRKSPAHKLFNWDDSAAAREFRLTQARLILGSFVIETEIVSGKSKKPRSISVPYISRSAPGLYEITTDAMRIPEKRDFMLSQALAEVKRWRRRYANLSELAVVFAALDEVQARTTRKRAG